MIEMFSTALVYMGMCGLERNVWTLWIYVDVNACFTELDPLVWRLYKKWDYLLICLLVVLLYIWFRFKVSGGIAPVFGRKSILSESS